MELHESGALSQGESQLNDGRYVYRWLDFEGTLRNEYAETLGELRMTADQIEAEKLVGLWRSKAPVE